MGDERAADGIRAHPEPIEDLFAATREKITEDRAHVGSGWVRVCGDQRAVDVIGDDVGLPVNPVAMEGVEQGAREVAVLRRAVVRAVHQIDDGQRSAEDGPRGRGEHGAEARRVERRSGEAGGELESATRSVDGDRPDLDAVQSHLAIGQTGGAVGGKPLCSRHARGRGIAREFGAECGGENDFTIGRLGDVGARVQRPGAEIDDGRVHERSWSELRARNGPRGRHVRRARGIRLPGNQVGKKDRQDKRQDQDQRGDRGTTLRPTEHWISSSCRARRSRGTGQHRLASRGSD